MQRSTKVAAITIAAAVGSGGLPAPAAADRADCSKRLERSYSRHYQKVRRLHGTRAPGRNIRRDGVRVQWGKGGKYVAVFDAMCGELRRSRRQLIRLARPPSYATLVRVAVPPAQPPAGVQSTGAAAGGTLQSIAACESGGNPATNTGNGYYGKYQFDLGTWQSVGGTGLPSSASEAEQDMRAAILYSRRGAAPWPVCGR